MKVDVQVRGLPQLKAELAKLSAAVAGRLARNAAMASTHDGGSPENVRSDSGLARDVRFWIAEPTYRGQASIGRS
jgi:hypothetical protein